MRILFLSYYFGPDFGPAAIRNTLIAKQLAADPRVQSVDVITTLPNRWVNGSADAPAHERQGKLTVHRLSVGASHDGVFNQVLRYGQFARKARKVAKRIQFDLIYATSSRLASGVLGAYLAKCGNAFYFLDIRDLFMDTIKEFYSADLQRLITPFLSQLYAYSVRSADRVNILSADFEADIRAINPSVPISKIFNGIDPEFILPKKAKSPSKNNREILYAGNIGFGQALEVIVPRLCAQLPTSWRFTVIGDGRCRAKLQDSARGLPNLDIKRPIARGDLVARYQEADILFLHLNDKPAFKKSLPSKFFEYVGSGKPIIAGTCGFLNRFVVDNNIPGVYFFLPNDDQSFFRALSRVELRFFDRSDFISRWTRQQKVGEMTEEITSCLL